MVGNSIEEKERYNSKVYTFRGIKAHKRAVPNVKSRHSENNDIPLEEITGRKIGKTWYGATLVVVTWPDEAEE